MATVQGVRAADPSTPKIEVMAPTTASTTGPTLTFVSRCGTGAMGIRSFLRLVRSSHCRAIVVLAMLTPGCIFPEPPTWEGPKKTQPLLWNPIPRTDQFHLLSLDKPFNFSVSERSEDAGEALRAIWYLGPDYLDYLNSRDIAPGHSDVLKDIQATWPVSTSKQECTTFNLVVTHISNDSSNNSDGGILDHHPLNLDDASTMTWWLNLNNASGCPTGEGTTP